MTTTKRTPKPTEGKRGQGRPAVAENDLGRERLLAVAERLPRELPPARVTIARIAQEAGADPALVRYYFGDRTALLMAVADRITNHNASRAAQLALVTGSAALWPSVCAGWSCSPARSRP